MPAMVPGDKVPLNIPPVIVPETFKSPKFADTPLKVFPVTLPATVSAPSVPSVVILG
jgi:hypothetical protein